MSHQLSSHQVLFAATAIKLGFATPEQVTQATKASLSEANLSMAQVLEQHGVINARQKKIISEQMERELTDCLDAADTMVALSPQRLVNRQLAKADDESEEWKTLDGAERYTSLNLHARGGQALIFKAYDQRIGREVAIKEFVPGEGSHSTTPTVRFLREARVTGQLEHPNIVPVHELDRRPDGTLYYIMRFVRGKTLAQRLAECHTLADRMKYLGAFWDVCNAIAFAHNAGVVHRDIKPQNAMVGEFGETVVVDWGIAKVRGKSDLQAGDLEKDKELLHLAPDGKTAIGTAIGTPSYMSPEQAEGEIDEIDERSDVWGLGAMLYEVLTGRPPYDGVVNTEILVKVIEAPLEPVHSLCPEVPPELAAVCEKALQKDKKLRYQSAEELAKEISAFMTGGRVRAYEYSSWELLRRFAAQNKTKIVAAGLILLVIISALVVVSFALRAKTRAFAQEQHERRVANFHLAQAYTASNARVMADQRYLSASVNAAAALLHNPAHPQSPYHSPDFSRLVPASRDLLIRAASDMYILGFNQSAVLQGMFKSDEVLTRPAFSPDGRHLAAGSFDKTVRIWDLERGKLKHSLAGHSNRVYQVAYSPDGRLLASASRDKSVILFETGSGKQLRKLSGHPNQVRSLAFAPDGRLLASADASGQVRLWEVKTGLSRRVITAHGDRIHQVAFSPDGRRLVTTSEDKTVGLWEVASGRRQGTLTGHHDVVRCAGFSPDGRLLATSGHDRRVLVWSAASLELLRELKGHKDSVLSLAFSPDGKRLASCGWDKTASLWDLRTGRMLLSIEAHRDGVYGLAFSPDGSLLATASYDNWLRLWSLKPARPMVRLENPGAKQYAVEFSPDGKTVVSGGSDHNVRLWDRTRQRLIRELTGHTDAIFFVATSPDSQTLASASRDKTVRIWNYQSGRALAVLTDHTDMVNALAYSPDGRLLASSSNDSSVRIWEVPGGKPLKVIPGQKEQFKLLSFSPDGERLAAGSSDNTVKIWNPNTGELLLQLIGHTDWVSGVSFSPDGKLIASSGKDSLVILWDAESGNELRRLRGHSQWVNCVRFSPDSRLVATSSDDHTVRIWSAETGEPLLILRAAGFVTAVAFDARGKVLAVADDEEVKLYPVDFSMLKADPAQLLEVAEHQAGVKLEGFQLKITNQGE